MPDAYRRFAEVDSLLEQALERPAAERRSFVAEAAEGDTELLGNVVNLLERAEGDSPLEHRSTILELGARAAAMVQEEDGADSSAEALETGSHFGAYQVLGAIGAGGMGEVYRARDPRLGREVALKVLPSEFAGDAGRLARLEREARMLAALNHPNITGIFELEESESRKALVLELVPGRTLAEALRDGALPVEEAVRLAIQIAEALEAAHDKGVLHRDLKPSNIKITSEGQVKVLDFGLAKPLRPEGARDGTDLDASVPVTKTGAILGTAPYMSPEQWRGLPADERSDLWALGCVLYEMLTGVRAFGSGSGPETAAAILEREPDWSLLPQGAPARVGELLRSCLEKDPGARLAGASRARLALRQALAELGAEDRSRARLATPARVTAASMVVVAVALVALAVGFGDFMPREPGARAIDSIAVLPFENTSEDPEGEYLSDGVTESLINSLSKLPDLRVVPRGIVFGYKGKEVDPEIVAEELGVRALVTGRIGERRGELVVAAELMDAARVAHLWGQHYTRPMADLLAVREEIVDEIVDELRLELTAEQRRRALDPATSNPEAYRLYLKTNFLILRTSPESLRRAAEYAQQAIDLDPSFALAHIALSQAHTSRAFSGFEPWAEAGEISRAAAQRALELDGSLPEAWVETGFVRHHFDWDWEGSERAFARALELDPDHSDARQGHSEALLSLGRVEAALEEARRAVELNPLSALAQNWLAWCSYHARRYPEALQASREVLRMEPNHVMARYTYPRLLLHNGEHDQAIRELTETLDAFRQDPQTSPMMATLLVRSGRKQEAEAILARLRGRTGGLSLSASHAEALLAVGEIDRAFEILERLFEERARGLLWIRTDPRWDPLRDDPRFDDLLQRMGLQR